MTQTTLFPIATSSQQGTPVSPSPKRVKGKAKKTHVTSGRASAKLLHPKDPLGLFSKTFMVTSAWGSTKCSLTWKPKATPQGRLLFQLVPSALPTEGTESGLWPTPRASEWKDCGPVGSKSHTHMYDRKYLCAQVKMWPTPSASEHKAGLPGDKMQKMLGNHPEVRNSGTGTLNPTWVEWLMGYPEGWTDLKD